ncbi:MAG: beta-lactamase family protein [Rhodothermia bacterium]|nr:beta-lactamase family protein [Rhodothermia bacterium]
MNRSYRSAFPKVMAAATLSGAMIISVAAGCGSSASVTCSPCEGTTAVEGRDATRSALPFYGAASFLRASHTLGAFPGAVAYAGWKGRVVFADAIGTYGINDAGGVDTNTVYDLASITKVVSTTTAVMLLVAEGKIDLDAKTSEYIPEFRAGSAGVTVRHLLTHSSGLPAFRRLYLETETAEAAIDTVFATELLYSPGSSYIYSDLGAILLGLIVERVSGQPLDRFVSSRVFEPLGMTSTRYRPPRAWSDRIALTEIDPTRGGALRGVVHDENAFHLGQVAGHAGLFSTAPDLARFAYWMLDAYHGRIDPDDALYVPRKVVREFITRQPGPEGSTRALGWDTPSDSASTAGNLMSRESFGHTGFTGTSMWIDPDEELVVILLTNRVNPTRANNLIRKVRGPLADSIFTAIKSLEVE